LRRIGWQVGLNLLLITAVFIVAAFLRVRANAWLPQLPGGDNSVRAVVWLGAMIVSLPMLIAVFRKLQAVGMLISEISVDPSTAGKGTNALRALVSATVFAASLVALVVFLMMLSSAILPSWNVLLVLALVLIAVVLLLRRSFSRVYTRAQIALHETLSQPSAPHSEAAPLAKPSQLIEAQLTSFEVSKLSPAAGKLIGELRLRTVSGASIVGIERAGENIINPGPDEEIQPGDRLLLLGSRAQLESAQSLLAGPEAL